MSNVRQIVGIVFIVGVVLLCSFFTPVRYYLYEVRHYSIFSIRNIVIDRFVLYIILWAVISGVIYMMIKPTNAK